MDAIELLRWLVGLLALMSLVAVLLVGYWFVRSVRHRRTRHAGEISAVAAPAAESRTPVAAAQ